MAATGLQHAVWARGCASSQGHAPGATAAAAASGSLHPSSCCLPVCWLRGCSTLCGRGGGRAAAATAAASACPGCTPHTATCCLLVCHMVGCCTLCGRRGTLPLCHPAPTEACHSVAGAQWLIVMAGHRPALHAYMKLACQHPCLHAQARIVAAAIFQLM